MPKTLKNLKVEIYSDKEENDYIVGLVKTEMKKEAKKYLNRLEHHYDKTTAMPTTDPNDAYVKGQIDFIKLFFNFRVRYGKQGRDQ